MSQMPAQSSLGSVLLSTGLHLPSGTPVYAALHETQTPVHAKSQQTSVPASAGQKPEMQSVAPTHGWPLTFRQAPVPVQARPAAHSLSGLVPAVTKSHTPLAPPVLEARHDWHVPAQLLLQQMKVPPPSFTQALLRQSLLLEQDCPLTFTQEPAPLHTLLPVHAPAASPEATLVHVPTLPVMLHLLQSPAQSALQQTPSSHCPVRHSPSPAQLAPLAFLQAPAPSHTSVPTHSASGSVPAAMLPQMPICPGSAQLLHRVSHAALQQTPSTQMLLTQSAALMHAVPKPICGLQSPPWQFAPGAHWELLEQLV